MAVPFAFGVPEGHARQGRLDDRQVARRDRPVHDHEVHAQAVVDDPPEPELQAVDAEHARRAPRRHRRQDRRHAGRGREHDRRRPARLVLRADRDRPLHAAQGAVPEPGASVRAQQRDLLRDERAQAAVRQARGAPGRQLRDRPHRARQDLRRPGHADREHPAARHRAARTRPTTCTRYDLAKAKALVELRRRGHDGDRVDPHHRSDAEGRAVHGGRARRARASRRA